MQDSFNGNYYDEQTVHLRDYLRVLYRGRWIILLSFVTVVAATAYFSFTMPPTYEAECMVMVEESSGLERTLFEVTPFGKQMTIVNNQVEILKSRLLAERVVDHLLATGYRDSLALFRMEKEDRDRRINVRELAIRRLRENLSVNPIRDTDIIRIKVKAPSAWEAAFLANTVAETYRKLDQESSRGEIDQVVRFLEEQLALKEKELRNSEEALRKYQETSGIAVLSEESQALVDQLVQFESAYQEAMTEIRSNEKRLEYLESQLGQMRGTLEKELSEISHPFIMKLRQDIAQIEAQLVAYKTRNFPENFQDVQEKKEKLEELKRVLNGEIKKILLSKLPGNDPLQPYQELLGKIIEVETDLQAGRARARALKKVVDEYNRKLEQLPDQSLQLARLERARKLNENIYLMMKEKYEESRITRAGQIGKVRIVDPAVPPEYPVSPKKKLNLILATIIGLMLGVGVTFFMEYLDNSVRTVEDVERLKLPLLGTIPEIKPEEGNGVWFRRIPASPKRRKADDKLVSQIADRLITHLRPKSPIAEAYRALRTQIQYAKTEKPIRTILVTSPGPGEGKSTSVTNLAIALAQMGSRTLLIDADLRRPVLHNLFGVKRENGLTNYLVGKMALEDIVKSTGVENLSLITTGVLPPNPSEILGASRMRELLRELEKRFDYVLIDSPPMIAVTDALVLAPWVDGVIMVLRSGKTDQNAVSRAYELLRNVEGRLLGVLLNDVSSSYMYGSYYYYYYYYYYYGTDDGKKVKKRSKRRRKKHHRESLTI